jgi:hypothetical protein
MHVILHRVWGDRKRGRDFFVAEAFGNETQYLLLSEGKLWMRLTVRLLCKSADFRKNLPGNAPTGRRATFPNHFHGIQQVCNTLVSTYVRTHTGLDEPEQVSICKIASDNHNLGTRVRSAGTLDVLDYARGGARTMYQHKAYVA